MPDIHIYGKGMVARQAKVEVQYTNCLDKNPKHYHMYI